MRFIAFSIATFASSLAMATAPIEGWYSSAFGGATWLFDNLQTIRGGFAWNQSKYHWGYHVGGRLGYQSNPLRYEAEYTYITAPVHSYVVGSFNQRYVGGNSNASALMANVYYDFPDMVPAVAPFIGLGVGFAHVNSTFQSYGPLFTTYYKTSDTPFAYQGTVGFTYNFSENYAINIAYRYLSTTQLDHLGKTYQANLGTVGFIYRFDGNNYK